MRLPDTHAHLDAREFDGDLDEVVERARAAGVGPILAVGSDLASSTVAVSIAKRHDAVFAAVGMHPHEAARFDEDAPGLQALLREGKVVAIGEIGLDFFRELSPRAEQMNALRFQLGWAAAHGLPVSIHSRSAEDEVLRALESVQVTAVMHCFGGTSDQARRAVEAGCYVSFAGNVTFPRATALREAACTVPEHRVLVESDAPVLAPQSRRGRVNEPAFVWSTAETLAAARGVETEDLARACAANAARVFGWSAA